MEPSTSMIEIDKTVLYSSAGLIIGWLLNEFKQMLAHRREDRKVIGIVLADLLEIRHNLFTMKTVTELFVEKFKIPPDQAFVLKGMLMNILPHLSEAEVLKKRYSDAVTRVASTEPFLAFQLRGQNFLQSYLDLLQSVKTADEKALPFVKQMEAKILKEALPNLERLMKALARSHSIRTRIDI